MSYLYFLVLHFISSFGDALLYFALPLGLGLATEDIRSTILMFFIPGLAMRFSALFTEIIKKRFKSVAFDYGVLLLVLGVVEIVTAFLVVTSLSKENSHYLVVTYAAIFVFIYAFLKEGIPRILFSVNIYSYFVSPKDYQKAISYGHITRILATFLGGLTAGLILYQQNWYLAFFIDAASFLIFGIGLIILTKKFNPKDPSLFDQKGQGKAEQTKADTADQKQVYDSITKPEKNALYLFLYVIPLMSFVSCLYYPYINYLLEKLNIAKTYQGVYLVSFAGLVVSLLNLVLAKSNMAKKFNLWTTVFIPLVFIVFTIIFCFQPNFISYLVLVIFSYSYGTIFNTFDYALRAKLPNNEMVNFNRLVLEKFSNAQITSCLFALFFYSFDWPLFYLIPVIFLAIAHYTYHWIKGLKFQSATALFLLCFFGTSCMSKKPTTVFLPSVTKDYTISVNLTYSAFMVLAETSAFLGRIDENLSVKPMVLKKYEKNGNVYHITLNQDYRSVKNESITAHDVKFSILYYLQNHPQLSFSLKNIRGATACIVEKKCGAVEIFVKDDDSLDLVIEQDSGHFIEKLMNPWFILFKENRPLYEKIGDCLLPYGTGIGQIIKCDDKQIQLAINGNIFQIVKSHAQNNKENLRPWAELINDNPGLDFNPTLTVMTLFANPKMDPSLLSQKKAFMHEIRIISKKLANDLHLKHAPSMMSSWMGIDMNNEIILEENKIHFSKKMCPNRPLKILLDSSLPNHQTIETAFRSAIPCEFIFLTTNADEYFNNFSKVDFGMAWFTPDELEAYNFYSSLDCSVGGNCYFNWKDSKLNHSLEKLSRYQTRDQIISLAKNTEKYIFDQGYAAPIAELNWWVLDDNKKYRPIHPAGLAQMKISDFKL